VKMINPESKHRRCIKRDRKLIWQYLTGAILRTGLLQHYTDIESKRNDAQWWTNHGPRVSRGTCFNCGIKCVMWKLCSGYTPYTRPFVPHNTEQMLSDNGTILPGLGFGYSLSAG
jgi:hypothetical protein